MTFTKKKNYWYYINGNIACFGHDKTANVDNFNKFAKIYDENLNDTYLCKNCVYSLKENGQYNCFTCKKKIKTVHHVIKKVCIFF